VVNATNLIMRGNHYYDEFHIKHPFAIVFRFAATVWPLVLPYCVANIASLSLLTLTKKYTRVDVSILPTAHAMMSILISYLGVSKVNLAYQRYITAQTGCGHVMMTLRELNQLAITMTEQYTSPAATAWRCQTKDAIVQLIHETVAVLRDERHSAALARNVGHRTGVGIDLSSKIGTRGSVQGARVITSGSDDPMVLVHSLRSHLYTESDRVCRKNDGTGEVKIELFERCKMIDQLHEFTVSYRNLLRLASSPLPFPLVQMGRTFTAVWTLSLPFVLIGDDFAEDSLSTFTFVILLTYGFLGLEFLSRMLANPFGGYQRDRVRLP